ncbi:hypothetical protein ACS0TY_018311 [Phlomoides rotata]
MTRLEKNILVILCNLERIFPPRFFNSMEHLHIHLAYKSKNYWYSGIPMDVSIWEVIS